MNGALDLNATEIDSLESQLEENGRVISSYEDNIEEKQQLLEQVCLCKKRDTLCREDPKLIILSPYRVRVIVSETDNYTTEIVK